jgi:hypothetical protein
VTWQEVSALAITVGFACFLWVRGVSLDQAVLTAAATVVSVKLLVSPPRAVFEGVRLLREIARHLRPGR